MKTVLFDRDGAITVDPEDLRVDSISKIKLFNDTIESLKRLHKAGYSIIMITNQAGISEGKLRGNDFYIINAEVITTTRALWNQHSRSIDVSTHL